jgi:integrase/recombinase XerD
MSTALISIPANPAAPGLPVAVIPRQADSDAEMIEIWLNAQASLHTRANYRRSILQFQAFVAKPLAQVKVGDLQAWAGSLSGLAPASRANRLAAIKSLFSNAQRLGYLPFNPGRVIKLPAVKRTLAERILAEPEVQRLLALESNPRNRALLTLLYAAGLRVSELCALRWRDLRPRDRDEAQLTVLGKGGRTRVILLPARAVALLGSPGTPDAPLFASRKGGGPLHRSQVHRLVKTAARRAGLTAPVSPHWLRHAHASHALERGASLPLVQQTLGHASVATTGVYLHARPSDSSARYLAV